MGKKTDTRLAIDIGAASLKIAEFSFPAQKKMVLEKFIYEEYAGEADSSESRLPLLEKTLKRVLLSNKFKSNKVMLSISGQTTYIRFIKLPPASEQEKQVHQLVAFEARENIPYPLSEVTWDYQLISPLDEEEQDEIDVMFAAIKNDIIKGFIDILERNKLQVQLVDITPTTFYNAAKANRIGEDEPAMILNIGSFCSTLVFINQNNFYARTIPVAGNVITQQIMKELQVPFAEAEKMKRSIGFVALGGAYEEEDSESATIISKIIRNVMIRLHSEINRSINVYKSQQKAPAPKKLYLAGGSSIINFTERFLSSKLKMETEYFNPFSIVSISESVDKNNLAACAHMTAEVIGLGLRKITTCPIEISLLPGDVSLKYFINRKKPIIIAACVLFILSLFTVYWGTSKENEMLSEVVKSRQAKYSTLRRDSSNLDKVIKEKNSIIKEFTSLTSKIKNRNQWIDILNSFENCLPDNTWLVDFVPYEKKVAEPVASTARRRTLFGRRTQPKPQAKNKKEPEYWIKVKGHSLILNENLKSTFAETLRKNLMSSRYFSNDPKDVTILTYERPDEQANNITTFTLDVKLAKQEVEK